MPGVRPTAQARFVGLQHTVGNRAVMELVQGNGIPPRPGVPAALAGMGQPIEPAVRDDMEQRFGTDFADVRIHTGATAEQFVQGANAMAVTVGDRIAFAPGIYSPLTTAGRRVLAHELAHVVQQRRGGPPPPPVPGSALEADADRAAASAEGGATVVAGSSDVGLSRLGRAPVQSRDPSGMSTAELEREILLVRQWLETQSVSGGATTDAEAYVRELERALVRRQGPDAARTVHGPASTAGPTRAADSWWSGARESAVRWVLRQQDDLQAELSQTLREWASGLPPEQYAVAEQIIGVVDGIFDTVQSLYMVWIGAQVGSVEVVVETIIALAKLLYSILDFVSTVLAELIAAVAQRLGFDLTVPGPSSLDMLKAAWAALSNIPAAVTAAYDAWMAEWRVAPPERKAFMVGRLVPQVLLIITGVAGALRAGGVFLARAATVAARAARPYALGLALGAGEVQAELLVSRAATTVTAGVEGGAGLGSAGAAPLIESTTVAAQPAAAALESVAPAATTAAPVAGATVGAPSALAVAAAPAVAPPAAASVVSTAATVASVTAVVAPAVTSTAAPSSPAGPVTVAPEVAAGFAAQHVALLGAMLGKPLTHPLIARLATIWNAAANPGEAATLTSANSRRLFNNHRGRFWRAVRADPIAMQLLAAAGLTFGPGPTSAPFYTLANGTQIPVTIDHIIERQTNPLLALDPANLRLSFWRENTVLLRLLNELDPGW